MLKTIEHKKTTFKKTSQSAFCLVFLHKNQKWATWSHPRIFYHTWKHHGSSYTDDYSSVMMRKSEENTVPFITPQKHRCSHSNEVPPIVFYVVIVLLLQMTQLRIIVTNYKVKYEVKSRALKFGLPSAELQNQVLPLYESSFWLPVFSLL